MRHSSKPRVEYSTVRSNLAKEEENVGYFGFVQFSRGDEDIVGQLILVISIGEDAEHNFTSVGVVLDVALAKEFDGFVHGGLSSDNVMAS